jgi:hypothetical protein
MSGNQIETGALIRLCELQRSHEGFCPHQLVLKDTLPGYAFPYKDPRLVERVQQEIRRVNGHYELRRPITAVQEAEVVEEILGKGRFEKIQNAVAALANPSTTFRNTTANRVFWETAFYEGIAVQQEYQKFIQGQPDGLSPKLGFMIPTTVFFEVPKPGEVPQYQTEGMVDLGKRPLQFGIWTPPMESFGDEAYQIEGALVPPGSTHPHSLARPW